MVANKSSQMQCGGAILLTLGVHLAALYLAERRCVQLPDLVGLGELRCHQ